MRIGGLQKSSMIDYPGGIACVAFLSGCNFHCPYCHNPSMARGQYVDEISDRDFSSFLEMRQGFLDAVVISGGEPTLHDDLPALCRRIRQLGFAVKLDTNGSRPAMLRRLLKGGLLDYVAMDIKTLPERYEALCDEKNVQAKVEESIALILSSDIAHEFRTTCVKPFVDRDTVARMARMISGAQRYFLQRFSSAGEILDPRFCTHNACCFSDEELLDMKETAARHVDHCGLR